MIVKERELVLVSPGGYSSWLGDWNLDAVLKYGPLVKGGYFKVKHQLVCSECHVGVRAQDDHRCDQPD